MVLKLDAIKDVSWQPAMQNKNGETMESCQKFQLLKKHKDACLTNGFSFVTKKTNNQMDAQKGQWLKKHLGYCGIILEIGCDSIPMELKPELNL